MPTTFFLVRAVVSEPLRDKLDPWTSTDHLPRALADFKAEKCWRFWSEAEAGLSEAKFWISVARLPHPTFRCGPMRAAVDSHSVRQPIRVN